MFLAYMYLSLPAWSDTAMQIEAAVVSSLFACVDELLFDCIAARIRTASQPPQPAAHAYFSPFLYATFLTHISHHLLRIPHPSFIPTQQMQQDAAFWGRQLGGSSSSGSSSGKGGSKGSSGSGKGKGGSKGSSGSGKGGSKGSSGSGSGSRRRELINTEEMQEDAAYWGRELGSSSSSGSGKGGSKGSSGSGKGKGGSKGSSGSGKGKGGSKGSSGSSGSR